MSFHEPEPPLAERDAETFAVIVVCAATNELDAAMHFMEAMGNEREAAFLLIPSGEGDPRGVPADLLAAHTSLPVLEVMDGTELRPGHVHVVPIGTHLSMAAGRLHVTPAQEHSPLFTYPLGALARVPGRRLIAVMLSTVGAEGSRELEAVRAAGGLVIVRDRAEAVDAELVREALAAGLVDHAAPVSAMPALVRHHVGSASPPGDGLAAVIDLLRTDTSHDFSLYKQGTLRRRVDRRAAMAGIATGDLAGYLELLRRDPAERRQLTRDMLINVTGFFRDPGIFDLLSGSAIAGLVRDCPAGGTLRVWVAGCSTGEEAYSLAILFMEQMAAQQSTVTLRLFATDADPDAIALAREGWYGGGIAQDVSPGRLARFFTAEKGGYRVSPAIRGLAVFAVQDVLGDPPFSRLDLISCRNLLIYLLPQAQARVLTLFHFALREGGFLLLGGAETMVPSLSGCFEVISKPARLFRCMVRDRPADAGLAKATASVSGDADLTASRMTALAALCHQLVLHDHAPAAVLIGDDCQCLYSLGPTARYLRVPSGYPTRNLLAMTEAPLSTQLNKAIERARRERTDIVVAGREMQRNGHPFSVVVRPVHHDGEHMMLVCFVEQPVPSHHVPASSSVQAGEGRALTEWRDRVRLRAGDAAPDMDTPGETVHSGNSEDPLTNEKYRFTNEKLLISKEELQSLNEELTALNSQLQETLDQQRTTADDLQNVLYSTDVATIFLDLDLAIRFFTPASRSLFSILPNDIGRPLGDLNSLAADGDLLADARSVLRSRVPVEREVETRTGAWYLRRVLPYMTRNGRVGGVVITFADITERRRVADALHAARRQADLANLGKSRFLAAASHDLRQPLQTLVLLQGLLVTWVREGRERELLDRIGETVGAMSGMLNALLDINQIEAGTVMTNMSCFVLDDLLVRMRDEFSYHAQARGLELRTVTSSIPVYSDRRLLEQIVRNLLSNALKYTRRGKVLLGCRRKADGVSVEIWDTGIGIPEAEQRRIFEEHHQVEQTAGGGGNGSGLGLSIVRRLSALLGHSVTVRSEPGRGSVFAVGITVGTDAMPSPATLVSTRPDRPLAHTGAVLVVEDDPEVRDLLGMVLGEAGHRVLTATDGPSALRQLALGEFRPDLLLVDFNLPGGMDGVELLSALRRQLRRQVPGLVLTADISSDTARGIALNNEVQLQKPVNQAALLRTIQRLLAAPPLAARVPPPATRVPEAAAVIHVIDDDARLRASIRQALDAEGWRVVDHANAEDFLDAGRSSGSACLLIDANLPGLGGIDLLRRLRHAGDTTPAIIMTGSSEVPVAVSAMRAGAADFIEKPVSRSDLAASIHLALERARDDGKQHAWQAEAAARLAQLTGRQRQIMDMVLAGHPSKNIAADLRISQRTVENHRAAIMRRTGAQSLPALARLALAADLGGAARDE